MLNDRMEGRKRFQVRNLDRSSDPVAIIRGATYAHLCNIDDISIRAWCIIYTCGRGERVAVERVATGGNRHHRSGSGID